MKAGDRVEVIDDGKGHVKADIMGAKGTVRSLGVFVYVMLDDHPRPFGNPWPMLPSELRVLATNRRR